ncbi:MAG: 1,2-diacylglycerol 3-glucosyltransferase [Nitrospirales bacterium]|nr:MAG: 1,2-diacylglycerol 3-glucosyltransferase [Nitrospirales bacterium]
MKILTHCYEFPPIGGGGAKVVLGLSQQLIALGHHVDLVTMKFRDQPSRNEVHGIHVYRAPCIRTSQVVCYPPELASYIASAIPLSLKLMKKKNYDLNHTHFVFPDGVVSWVLKKLTGFPYILTVHGSDVPGYNPDRFRGLHKLLSPIWRKVVESATHIVSPSETVRDLVLKQCPTVPISIVPNGIDLNKFLSSQQKLPRVLVVSRLFKRKGIQHVLQALAELENLSGYEVDIVGDGPYLATLQNMASNMNVKVKFWGYLENNSSQLKQLFGESSIFVFPSESENFPIVLLEAMAAKLAIITTQSTGCAEVVGDAGILVKIGDVRAIRYALAELTRSPERCRTLGELARQRLEAHYSWKTVTEQYLEIYRKFADIQSHQS